MSCHFGWIGGLEEGEESIPGLLVYRDPSDLIKRGKLYIQLYAIYLQKAVTCYLTTNLGLHYLPKNFDIYVGTFFEESVQRGKR